VDQILYLGGEDNSLNLCFSSRKIGMGHKTMKKQLKNSKLKL